MHSDLPRYIRPLDVARVLESALREDMGFGDVTTEATIPPSTTGIGRFVAKEDGILAGLFVAKQLFGMVDSTAKVEWYERDGGTVAQGEIFGSVQARARSLLLAERLALNILQRMSGIATATREMVQAIEPFPARIRDTRKTVPGLRLLDKWAVRLGGGENHRLGLYDRILIKDNHIAAAGGIRPALEAAQTYARQSNRAIPVDVEARTLAEVSEALTVGGFEVLLLDNMARLRPDGSVDADMLQAAVVLVDGRFGTEASGNVTLQTVRAIAATGVDHISSGSLTHSVRALDISLKIEVC